jgi:hypothetical protein
MPKDLRVLMKAGNVVPKFLRLCLATNAAVLKIRRPGNGGLQIRAGAPGGGDQARASDDAHGRRRQARGLHRRSGAEGEADGRVLEHPPDRIEWMEELFKTANVITNAVPISELVDQSVRDDAAKLAGAK